MAKSKRRLKPIPKFASEAQEREFWETHDSVGYVDWSKATVVSLPALQPSRSRPKAARKRVARAARG